jgi:hypothetical protein
MKHVLLAASIAAALFLALPARALAATDHAADSPKATVTVTSPLAVGNAVLKAGDYKVQCRLFEGKTFLVVWSVETGKEVARVACVKDALTDKVSASQLRSLARPDGTQQLQSVRIKGESVAHRLVAN